MLILSRRVDEALIFSAKDVHGDEALSHAISHGERIIVRILSAKGKQIRIGITAPDSIAVHREEIQDKVDTAQTIDAPSVTA